jgi:MoxR-like ATPase
VLTFDEVRSIQKQVRSVRVDDALSDYLVRIASVSRSSDELTLGISPRGTLLLQRAAQAHALLDGRSYIVPDDIKDVAVPVLAHRVVPRSRASVGGGRGREAETILAHILDTVPVPL